MHVIFPRFKTCVPLVDAQQKPRGHEFGWPEQDPDFGSHLCTLPPARFLGLGPRRGKYALYEEGLAIKRELGDKLGIAAALSNLGVWF